MTEFAANNNELASIEYSLIFINNDVYTCINFDIVELFNAGSCEQILK